MPPKIRTRQELVRLTPAERRVAALLVAGLGNSQIAERLGLSTGSVTGHLRHISRKFPAALTREAKAHAILCARQVAPPPAPKDVPKLTEFDLRLLRAVAELPSTHDIAHAAGVAVTDTRPAIQDLVRKTNATNAVHLVGHAHAWGLLGDATVPPHQSPAALPPELSAARLAVTGR
ncbi:helix-turn-helix transcriptional regulator [Streptomyces sp. NPDC005012]|uniref:helix-turn-helix domain-containing protein n=1 Tax=Streptomyces sp. NPDC005012 TaxID=3154558 RepID=UPI0033A71A8B